MAASTVASSATGSGRSVMAASTVPSSPPPEALRRRTTRPAAAARVRLAVPLALIRGDTVPNISLTAAVRQDLFDRYRRDDDPEVRLRAHILLLLDGGHPWATISAVLF